VGAGCIVWFMKRVLYLMVFAISVASCSAKPPSGARNTVPSDMAVIQSPPGADRAVDCDAITLPMFEGRVNPDRVAYSLEPDQGTIVFMYFGSGPDPQSIHVRVPYAQQACFKALTSPVQKYVNEALDAYRRDGTTGKSLPGGP
jgi:hypothetical protein